MSAFTDSKPTALDFFAGSGLASEGLREHFHVVWANDICAKKAAVYKANHDCSSFVLGPIEGISGGDLPRADLSWGSFPCQDLSLAGKMGGIHSRRSGLVWEWLRVMDEMPSRPPTVVAENVVGLVSAGKGEHYRQLHHALVERGYRVGAFVLDAVHWLPQSRKRVFVVGVRTSLDTRDFESHGPIWCHSEAVKRAARGLKAWVWWSLPQPGASPNGKSALERIVDWEAPCDQDDRREYLLSMVPTHHRRRLKDAQRHGQHVFPGYKRIRGGRQVLELRFDGISGCLRTPDGGSSRQVLVLSNGTRLDTRLLTAREAARLMGAPDSYELPGSYNDGYRAMGDAVAVPVVRFLTKYILKPMADLIGSEKKEDGRAKSQRQAV